MSLEVIMGDPGSLWPVPPGLEILVPSSQDVLWGAVAFVVIFSTLRLSTVPGLDRLLRARTEAIQGRADGTEELRRRASQTQRDREALISQARDAASKVRQQAQIDGSRDFDLVRAQAVSQAEASVLNARQEIRKERDRAVTTLRADVGSLALDLASSVLGTPVRDEASAAAIQEFLRSNADAP